MTLQEMEESLKAQIAGHKLVHSRYGFVDVDSELLLEAFQQIKKAVRAIECGIAEPSDHRAEAYLLMLLEQATHHGYTPKLKE